MYFPGFNQAENQAHPAQMGNIGMELTDYKISSRRNFQRKLWNKAM